MLLRRRQRHFRAVLVVTHKNHLRLWEGSHENPSLSFKWRKEKMNQLTIMGNVVAPAEIRTTKTGVQVGELRIAHNKRFFDKVSNQWKDGGTMFFNIIAWKEKALKLDSFTKGSKVFVTGEFSFREYDKKDGTKGHALEVTADQVFEVNSKQSRDSVPVTGSEFGDRPEQNLPF